MSLRDGGRLQPVKPPVLPPQLTPAPGRRAIIVAAVLLGALILALQLWLLTIALDLYLAGEGRDVWQLALLSGIFFTGGVFALLLTRQPEDRS